MGYQTGVHEADELTDGHLASVASLLLNLRAFESVEGVHATQRAPLPGLKAHDYQQSQAWCSGRRRPRGGGQRFGAVANV